MIVDIYKYFKEHPKFNKRIGNNFLLVEYKCPLNVEEFQLWTESHLITYVISGKKDWYTTDHTYSLSSGDALFLRKGVYTTKQHLEEDYCVMLFFMNDDFIKDFIRINESINAEKTNLSHPEQVLKIDTDKTFNTMVESMFQYLTMDQSIPQELVEIKFKELIFSILLNKKNSGFKNLLLDISQSAKTNIEHVMQKNFQYDLPLEAFAKLAGRSLSSFKRDFEKHFGATPSKWLINKRLGHSKILLQNSELNINEICYESGFKNTSHFIKSFKTQFNQTPNQFRATALQTYK